MAIQVTCPKCFKRFSVSEKFAGKTGPCPNCKNPLRVPDKTEEVTIHAPADDSPKDSKGQSVLKPIKREETDVTRRGILLASLAVVGGLAAAVACRFAFDGVPVWVPAVGAILLGPPLVRVGYALAHDSELEPYKGAELRNRVLIAGVLSAATWLIYAFLPSYLLDLESPAHMSLVWFGIAIAAMIGIGGIIGAATFELEYGSGLIPTGLYIVTTLVLAVAAGLTLAGAAPETVL